MNNPLKVAGMSQAGELNEEERRVSERRATPLKQIAMPYLPAVMSPAMRDAVSPKWTFAPDSMYTDLLQAIAHDASVSEHDTLRDKLGQALNDALAQMSMPFDRCDSNEVDHLANAVMAVLVTYKNPWKEAVMDQCAVAFQPFHENDPKTTIDGIISWHVDVASDPTVNERQAQLEADHYRMNFLAQRADVSYTFDRVELAFETAEDFESTDVRAIIDNGAVQV